jgi:hypothetical protein
MVRQPLLQVSLTSSLPGFSTDPHCELSTITSTQNKILSLGGGSGFGEATAKKFAVAGAKVVVCDINTQGGTRMADSSPSIKFLPDRCDQVRRLEKASRVYDHGVWAHQHPGTQRRHLPPQQAHDGGHRGRLRPGVQCEREIYPSLHRRAGSVPDRARTGWIDHQRRVNRRLAAATRPDVVQRIQGRRLQRHQGSCG